MIPNCSGKRSSSKLYFIKTFLRNMTLFLKKYDRLSATYIISIKSGILDNNYFRLFLS